jgi:hypothetical protein
MSSRTHHRSLARAVLLGACASSSVAHAGQDAAKRYFQNGVELITQAQPNYQDAYYQFQLAYEESGRSWKVLGNLGLCALKLERDEEAVRYYELYLQQGGKGIAPEERNAIEQDLLLLKGNLAEVRLTSAVPDAKVVDRRSGSPAPAQSYKLEGGALVLKLRAGSHNLTAYDGTRQLSWDVVLEPKSTAAHAFDFEAKSESAPVNAAPATNTVALPDSPASSPKSSLRVPGYIALGVGAVGLGLGGYFAWKRADKNREADDVFACNSRPLGCTTAERAQVRRSESDASAAGTRSWVAFGVGGAAVVGGVVMLLVSRPSSGDSASTRVVPLVGLDRLGVSGTF